MVDIETLGTNKRSVIQSIGAVAFDDDGFLNEYDKTNPTVWYGQVRWRDASQINLGRIADHDTLQWWSTQNRPLQVLQNPDDYQREYLYDGLQPLLHEFSRFVSAELARGGKMVSKGVDFDLAIIETGYTDLGLKPPWKYNATRCLRGYLDAAFQVGISPHLHMGVQGGNEMAHHAAEDAIFQTKVYVRYAHELWKIRNRTSQKGLFDSLTPASAAPTLDPAP